MSWPITSPDLPNVVDATQPRSLHGESRVLHFLNQWRVPQPGESDEAAKLRLFMQTLMALALAFGLPATEEITSEEVGPCSARRSNRILNRDPDGLWLKEMPAKEVSFPRKYLDISSIHAKFQCIS
jgi:hypothetical protein